MVFMGLLTLYNFICKLKTILKLTLFKWDTNWKHALLKNMENLPLGICVWSPFLRKVLLPHPHDIAMLTYNPSPRSGANPKFLLPACNRVRLAGHWTRKNGRVVPLLQVKPKCVKGTVNITESKNWEISEEIKTLRHQVSMSLFPETDAYKSIAISV